MLPHGFGWLRLWRGRVVEAGVANVFVERVDFPQRPVRVRHPELGLAGVTALDALLPLRGDTGLFESALHLHERRGIGEPQPDVVKRPAGLLRARVEREHQRRHRDLELGVIVEVLGRRGAEQHAVEPHRAREVGDVQPDVKTGRGTRWRSGNHVHLAQKAVINHRAQRTQREKQTAERRQ